MRRLSDCCMAVSSREGPSARLYHLTPEGVGKIRRAPCLSACEECENEVKQD